MLVPELGDGALGEIKSSTLSRCATAVVIAVVPLSGSAVDFFVMLSDLPAGGWMPLQGWLGTAAES
jgi:hypothetical protein